MHKSKWIKGGIYFLVVSISTTEERNRIESTVLCTLYSNSVYIRPAIKPGIDIITNYETQSRIRPDLTK
jgi:hypothetical protein